MTKLKLEKIAESDIVIPYTIVENLIFDIEGLSANKKLLLLVIRKYVCADKKPAYPSYNQLMKQTGINSKTTLKKNIDFFEWLKFFEKINRTDPKTKEKCQNYYILSLKNIEIIIGHFKEKKYSFKEVEKYFENNYYIAKNTKIINTEFLKNECKFLKE